MNLRIRSLAKIFGPVLLTTTLVLPAELLVAPSVADAAPRAEKAQRGEKNHEKNKQRNQNQGRGQVQRQNRGQVQVQKQQREQAKQNHGQQRRQQVQVQAQQRREAQRIQQQQKSQLKVQAQQRQAQLQRQQYQRRVQIERQADIQRQAELRRQADLRRQSQVRRDVRRDNRNYYPGNRQYYGNPYRNGGRFRYDGNYYGPNDRFHIDGFVVDEGSGCSLFKDHGTGEIFALVGNIGDIQQGDHMRLQGRVVDGGVCDWRGTGFEVLQVKTLWDNNRHEHAIYDYQRDRVTFEQYLDRHDYRDDRYGYGN